MTKLQNHFYDNFGLFMERKRGEFYYGISSKIVSKKEIVDRVDLARAMTAYTGEPAKARSSENRIFEEEGFDKLLASLDVQIASKAHFALQHVSEKSRTIPSDGIKYAKYAVLYAVSIVDQAGIESDKPVIERERLIVDRVLAKWTAFELYVAGLATNATYASGTAFNYDGYFKGTTVAADIAAFPWLGASNEAVVVSEQSEG